MGHSMRHELISRGLLVKLATRGTQSSCQSNLKTIYIRDSLLDIPTAYKLVANQVKRQFKLLTLS